MVKKEVIFGHPSFVFLCHSCCRLYKELVCLDICEKCTYTLHVRLLIIQYYIHSFPLGFQDNVFG